MTEEGYDVVLATHERMGQYALNSTRARRVLDLHDVVSRRHQMLARSARNPVMRLVHNWEARRVASYERASLDEFDAVWVTTPTEAEQLRAHDRNHRLRATLRGIDLDDFPYTWRGSDSRAMVFSGHMSYEPNVDSVLYFLKEIYASVRQAVPEASLQVVGNYPHARVVRAARRAPAVEVTGRVPSVVNHLARGRVFVVPMRVGTGVRVKLLEAMAVGVPVVTTAVGCDGLGVKHEEQVLVADRPEDFAREISRLFADSQLAEALSRNGRRFVEQHYDLEKTAAEVELLLTQLVAE
jgi:glycosyltransferase involved in cell wall biosynthesis